MVQQELVPPNKISEKSITVQWNTETYPLAEMQLEMDSRQLQVEAAVSDKLPVAAIIGHSWESSKEVKNKAGSIPAEGNPGEQEIPQDQEKMIGDSSQVNEETICDSLAMFRMPTEPMNK